MLRSRSFIRLLSGIAVLAACAEPSRAGPIRGLRGYPVRYPAVRAPFVNVQSLPFKIAPNLLQGARMVSFPEILKETQADKSPAAQEVHTYLRDPAAWQRNMIKNHQYELGLPEFRLYLANGTIIRSWSLPASTKGLKRFHRFTDVQPGYRMQTVFDFTHLYEIQTPPKVKPPAILPKWLGITPGMKATLVIRKTK